MHKLCLHIFNIIQFKTERGFENLGKNKTVTMHITFVSLGVVSTVFVKVQHYEVTDGILYL